MLFVNNRKATWTSPCFENGRYILDHPTPGSETAERWFVRETHTFSVGLVKAILWASVGDIAKTIEISRIIQNAAKRRNAKNSYQVFLYMEDAREARFVIFLRRTRTAFMSSVAINIIAALILFFNISIPLWVSAILSSHLYRRFQKVFIAILMKIFAKTVEKVFLFISSEPPATNAEHTSLNFFASTEQSNKTA